MRLLLFFQFYLIPVLYQEHAYVKYVNASSCFFENTCMFCGRLNEQPGKYRIKRTDCFCISLDTLPFVDYIFIAMYLHCQIDTRLQNGNPVMNVLLIMISCLGTVLVPIKLTKNPVSLRLRCGSDKLYFCRYFTMFCDI